MNEKKRKQQQSTAEQLSESGRLTKVLSSTVQAFRADAHLDNSFDSMHDNTATFFGRRAIFQLNLYAFTSPLISAWFYYGADLLKCQSLNFLVICLITNGDSSVAFKVSFTSS